MNIFRLQMSTLLPAEVEMELTAAERKKLNESDGDFSKAFLKKLASKVKFNSVIVNKLESLIKENPERRNPVFWYHPFNSRKWSCAGLE